MTSWLAYLCVALGGAAGACLRHFIQESSTKVLGVGFPFGTLAVNVVGAFGLGLAYALLQVHAPHSALRLFLSVGLLGALTTFSTFSLDTLLLIQSGEFVKAGLNVFANVILCLCGLWLAISIVRG